MAVKATLSMDLAVDETFSAAQLPAAAEGARTIRHAGLGLTQVMQTGSAPDAESVSAFKITIDGTDNIDLTALPATLGGTLDATGKKVRALYLVAGSANVAAITIGDGASNGYELAGNTWKVALTGGQRALLYAAAGAPDVGASAKMIDVSGTNGDTLDVVVVVG